MTDPEAGDRRQTPRVRYPERRSGAERRGPGRLDDDYYTALTDVAVEVRDAMVGLDQAINRLDAALAQHRTLKEAHDAPQ